MAGAAVVAAVAAVMAAAAVVVVAALWVPAAAREASMSAALEASESPALEVSVASAVAALVSVYTADAHFLDAASAAVAVAAVAAVVGAAEPAGYGHPSGAGSTPAGPNLHRQVKNLASRRSKSNKQRWLRKRSDQSHSNPPRPRVSLGFSRSRSGSLAIFAAILRASSLLSNLAADRRPRRAPEAMTAIPKSWKPSRRDGSSSLYCLIGDFVSQEIAFVRLIRVIVAIVHHGGVQFLDGPRRREAARHLFWSRAYTLRSPSAFRMGPLACLFPLATSLRKVRLMPCRLAKAI